MIYDYSQESKSIVRKEVLESAVKYLTEERASSAIITEDYFIKMWEQSKHLLKRRMTAVNLSVDDNYKEHWLQLHKSKIGVKHPSDLKVIYLCGPHPMNDLKILIDCGVRSENIWAVEFSEDDFKSATIELKEKFPFIKVFNGKLERFIEVYPDVYDIVYFDSCKSIPNKEQKTHEILYSLFFNQKLSEISIVITNFSKPDITNENMKEQFTNIISSYFYANKIPQKDNDNTIVTMSPLENGERFEYKDMKDMIIKDFDFYYQHFITSFIYDLATFYSPFSRALQNENIASIFIKKNILNNNGKNIGFSGIQQIMGDIWGNKKNNLIKNLHNFSYGSSTGHYYPIYDFEQQHFIDSIESIKELQWFYNFFSNKRYSFASINESLSITEFLTKKSLFIDKEYVEVFKAVMREEVQQCMQENIYFDSNRHVSVDIPMCNIPLQLLVYQVGFPYHINVDKIKRFEYKAKKTTMYTDLIVLDKCRYIYDWIPTTDLFCEGFKNLELQLATRICINRLYNTSSSIFSEIYKYGTFFSPEEEKANGYRWYSELKQRTIIENSNNNYEKDELSSLVLEIKEVVNCFKNVEEKNILLKEAFPCGRAYISGIDRRTAIVKALIDKKNIYKDIYDICDNDFYINCYSNQSLKANEFVYNKVMRVLHKYGIKGNVKTYVD